MKKLFMICILATLSACATITPSSLIYFTPTSTTSSTQIGNGKSFTLVSQDERSSQYIARITAIDEPDIPLNSSQPVRKTYETALFQQFLSQGFNVTRESNNTVTVHIQKTFAKVTKAEVDYTIEATVGLQVVAETPAGKMVKTYNGFTTQEGSFDPSLLDIQDVINRAASRVLAEIGTDQELQKYMSERF
ncbi:MAG: YajG family lipoprotein [Vibrio sp.]